MSPDADDIGAPGPPMPAGDRAAMTSPAPGRALRWSLAVPALLHRAGLGPLLGHRSLRLVTTEPSTGHRRETVLAVLRYDPATEEAVVLSAWGFHTGWLADLEAGGVPEVRIGRAAFRPTYRLLGVTEAEAVLAAYERQNRLSAPIVRRLLGGLLGRPYDGSPSARRQVVIERPLVGFRPASD